MVDCFWMETTGRVRVSLRRYGHMPAAPCSYCDAKTILTEIPAEDAEPSGDVWPHDDPRWPRLCAGCGRPFGERDVFQLFHETIYRRQDTGAEMVLNETPPGAMWDADWYRRRGPDGRYLVVRLPCGSEWHVDGPSSNGPGWKREGDVPKVTARPSIRTSKGYHGFLNEGRLVACDDSKY